MPFVKLDTGMLRSSIWFERDQRELFITALLMAEPYFTEDPLPQLYVDRLEPTGFVAPPGPYGMVRAAGSGIIRIACLDQEKGMIALEQLGEPDKQSRSQDFEGRRMIRVDGGYIVLNYFKYREYDRTGAERQARHREKKKIKEVTPLRHEVTPLHRDEVTHAEADVLTLSQKRESERERIKILAEVPIGLKTPEFEKAWKDWTEYKLDSRRAMNWNRPAQNRELAMLERLGPKTAILWIDNTMRAGLDQLCAPRESFNGTHKKDDTSKCW